MAVVGSHLHHGFYPLPLRSLCAFSYGKPASRLGPPVWSVTQGKRGTRERYSIAGYVSECKDVSSDQVQTTLCLDPASTAEVNSAVSATMRHVVTRGVKNAVAEECS